MSYSIEFVKSRVNEVGYFICRWDQLSASSSFDLKDDYELSLFYENLQAIELDTLPRIVKLGAKYSIANALSSFDYSNIVFCKPHLSPEKSDKKEAKAMLTVKLAAIMAKVDGKVEDDEIVALQNTVNTLSYLKESKKYSVFVRGLFFMQQKFIREDLLLEFSKLDEKMQSLVINIMKSIAVADGYIDKSERTFLAELYRASGKSSKTVAKDLTAHARLEGVPIIRRKLDEDAPIEPKESYEKGVLASLIDDFMEF
jgi:tellurite resistance protein